MSAVTGYVLGYEDGRSAADISRRNREIVDRVFYGQRTVEVDQSYLDTAPHSSSKNSADSDHNFDKADLFHDEALEWKADAERHEARAAALQARYQRFRLSSPSATPLSIRRRRQLLGSGPLHQTTHEEKWGLNLFRLIATWLIEAHIAGRSDRPEFAELRDMAKDVTDAIQRGEPFRGYRDEPEKKARLQTLAGRARFVPEIPRGLRADRPS